MASVDATIESIKRSLGILEVRTDTYSSVCGAGANGSPQDEFDSLSKEASHVAMDDGQSETDRALSQCVKDRILCLLII